MKLLTNTALLIAFILPYGIVAADTHDEVTMDVIEHSSSDRYEHEIELPEANETESHDLNNDKKDDSSETETHEIEAVESPEVESPEVESPEVESPEAPEAPEAPEVH